jgi:serine/threonine protein kinase/ribosomal protein L40E
MPREKPLTVGTELTGRHTYRVKRLVGGGGMAWVYQVEKLDDTSTSLWALKELRPQTEDPDTQAHARNLFDQEATILSQLDHPNLPQVIDFFEDAGRAYLVMEFIWGESLEKRLEQTRSPLMERQVLQWAVQVCEVLDYLHTRQPPVIFRDLKPSNIMVNNAGVIKLVDFGIARTYKENKLQDTIALGSENYAAPEQWGQAQTDPRADIYGLGATVYHLLANMPPSPAFLPTEPTPLNQLNAAVSTEAVQIVSKSMARDREARYQSAADMRDALLACLPGYVSPLQSSTGAKPKTTTPPSLRQPQARPAVQTQVTLPAQKQAQQLAAPQQAQQRPATAATQTQLKPVVRRKVRRVKVCPKCKHRNELSARFCVRCGYAFIGVRPAVLRVIEPVRAAWEMPVAKSPMLFGRARPEEGYRPDFDMSFYDPEGYISRRHGQIIRARNGYFITDLGSSNGTYVNDRLLPPHKPRLLRNGDEVTIGEVVFQFLLR